MMQAAPKHHDNTTTTQLSQLPPALTAHILQFVPRERLSCCALVCSAWRAAAAQATVHIDCKLRSAAAAEALEAWLEQHGRLVESLELTFGDGRWAGLQLPWAELLQLQSLSLSRIHLPAISNNSAAPAAAAGSAQLGGSSGGQSSNMPLLRRLKQLQLQSCQVHSPDLLLQLVSSPGLTSLVLATDLGVTVDTLTAILERLPQLVVLRLPCLPLSRAAIKHVAGMSSLQHLELTLDAGEVCGECLADLPSSLTRLQLVDNRRPSRRVGQPTLPAQLQQLTRLQKLELGGCSLLPAVLASMPQLQHLFLQACNLLPREANHQPSPAATAVLLGALQQLTRLQHLEIDGMQLAEAGPPPQQWAALTASTQLTHLSLVGDEQQPLPQGAAQHMFPAGRQLRQLHELAVQALSSQQDVDWCLDSQDLGSIISCCPQLHDLNVYRTVRKDADVSALLQLPASCTSLTIGGVGFSDAAASVVAQLTQLRELTWVNSPQLTDLGLQQLTALQGLSRLYVRDCYSISSSVFDAGRGLDDESVLDLESSDTQMPVWQQLQAVCELSLSCVLASRQQARDEVAVVRQQLADTQAQLAESQAQVQQLQQQLAALQMAVGPQQQQP